MEILKETDPASKTDDDPGKRPARLLDELSQKQLELGEFVDWAARAGLATHEFEQDVWRKLLALGRGMMNRFFQQVGDGDMGAEVELPNGRTVRRLEQPHVRPYQSIFGSFELSRMVYGTREGQKIEWVPLDQRLQLPESKFSYMLQDWDQHLTVETPYGEVSATVARILGFSQPVDSLERMSRKMAQPVVDYWDSLATPPASEEGELMVVSADGKGVPIRRGATTSPIEDHEPSEEPKPGAKMMALVGATFTVDRFERTPEYAGPRRSGPLPAVCPGLRWECGGQDPGVSAGQTSPPAP